MRKNQLAYCTKYFHLPSINTGTLFSCPFSSSLLSSPSSPSLPSPSLSLPLPLPLSSPSSLLHTCPINLLHIDISSTRLRILAIVRWVHKVFNPKGCGDVRSRREQRREERGEWGDKEEEERKGGGGGGWEEWRKRRYP